MGDAVGRQGFERARRLIATLADGHAARLRDLAARERLSPFHLQRSFRRHVGLTPQRFAAFTRASRARGLLVAARNVLDVALEVGLSGPGRLHDQLIAIEALSPGEVASGGRGVELRWGVGPTPFGAALAAWTSRGVCRIDYALAEGAATLAAEWPHARHVRDDPGARSLLDGAFDGTARAPRLLLRGSPFQVAVWRALLTIPAGRVDTYAGLAAALGRPGAARAVGTAVGANPVAVLVPCHRVIRASGLLGGYRWGLDRKAALLACELRAGATSSS